MAGDDRTEGARRAAVSEFLVVTGLSGAGRSTAAATLEDLGWFVIDNLPAALVPKVAELAGRPGSESERVVLVIGRGGGDQLGGEPLADVDGIVRQLRASQSRVTVLFLDAPDEVLVRRFEGTRRRHPVGSRGVRESIADERRLLEPLRDTADVVLDTAELNVNQLRSRIQELFGHDGISTGVQTSILSFGFKHGVPLDVDMLFDCRFLPNPFWSDTLRDLSGLDPPVREFVLGQPEAPDFLARVDELLASLLPAFVREGRSYLTVAIGCTGGRHRSVAVAEALAARLADRGVTAAVFHRDIDR